VTAGRFVMAKRIAPVERRASLFYVFSARQAAAEGWLTISQAVTRLYQ
jgi:hypothetical protein